MIVDNTEHVAPFIPEKFDGDTFLYTELLNRNRKSGNNKGRLVRTFYHRDRDEFFAQMYDIRAWCDFTGARAYTRLSPRSFKRVGHRFLLNMIEQSNAENWEGMRHGYSHACGVSSPLTKFWLLDVDEPDAFVGNWLGTYICLRGEFVCKIPSRKGYHIITRPFDTRLLDAAPAQISLHKDNGTNLYIPEGA